MGGRGSTCVEPCTIGLFVVDALQTVAKAHPVLDGILVGRNAIHGDSGAPKDAPIHVPIHRACTTTSHSTVQHTTTLHRTGSGMMACACCAAAALAAATCRARRRSSAAKCATAARLRSLAWVAPGPHVKLCTGMHIDPML
jgi:hypothetical protein